MRFKHSALLAVVAILQVVFRRIRIEYAMAEVEYDFRVVWHPLATEVASGTPLYTGTAVDNKPPVFQAINLAANLLAPEAHATVMLLLVGVANALVAIQLYRLATRQWTERVGIVAGFLFLLVLPLVEGTFITVRSMALVGVLLSLYTSRPSVQGTALALATLVSQYAALAIPFVLWRWYREDRLRAAGRVCAAGLLTTVGVFAGVGLVWGLPSVLGGLYWSFGLPVATPSVEPMAPPVEYLVRPNIVSPITAPVYWAGSIAYRATFLAPLLLAICYGLWTGVYREAEASEWLALLGLFLLPLLVRSIPSYWVYALPFAAVLATVAVTDFLRASPVAQRAY